MSAYVVTEYSRKQLPTKSKVRLLACFKADDGSIVQGDNSRAIVSDFVIAHVQHVSVAIFPVNFEPSCGKMPGKFSFQDSWLKEERFKDWILRDIDKRKARCGVCAMSLSVASMGESSLKVHMKTDRHTKNLARHRSETSGDADARGSL